MLKRAALALTLIAGMMSTAFGQASLFPANTFYGGPTTGAAKHGVPRLLVGEDMPLPSASTLGGIRSLTCAANNWLNTISTSGVPACARPTLSDILGTGTLTVSGGSITGLSNPSVASDAANKAYVDANATGLKVLAQSGLVTAAVLPNTPTYANGASGVGATLTAGANSTLTVDGTVATLGTVVLVKNQASDFQNGIYTVTTAGSGAAAWVLTRATYFDQAAEMTIGSYTFVTGGATLANTSYVLQAVVTTVGTTPVTFVLFAQAGAVVSSIAGNTGVFTLSHGLTNSTNDLQIDIATQRGYLSGLVLSTAGSSATFGISAGVAVDATSTDSMKLTSAFTKTTAAWALGTGNGALDTGSIAASTWYHVFIMKRPDTGLVSVCISVTVTGCTTGGSIPAAYTLFRRIGSLRTNGSSQWVLFHQTGDEFLWDVPIADVAAVATGTAGSLPTLTVAPGVSVTALFSSVMTSNTVGILALFHSPNQANQVAGGIAGNFHLYLQVANLFSSGQFSIRTNTSRQIRMVSNATTATCAISITTQGYIDTRGRFN